MSNVKAMPISGKCNSNNDVSAVLRLIADQIELGDRGDIKSCIVILEASGEPLKTLSSGKGGLDNARVMGIMFSALNTYMAGQQCTSTT